jgi:hypothetical protein
MRHDEEDGRRQRCGRQQFTGGVMKLGRALSTGVATEQPRAHEEQPAPAAAERELPPPSGARGITAPTPAEVPAVR